MSNNELLNYEMSLGFSNAELIDTKDLVFDPSFRPYCAENVCGQYGINYTCPPDCGTPEEMKQKIITHKKALVLESTWSIKDYSDLPAIKQGKAAHNHWQIQLLQQARSHGTDGFLVGASGCTLCSPCKRELGEPCCFPSLRWSCMSAYCIYVKKLADLCGMQYNPGTGSITFYGMLVFD